MRHFAIQTFESEAEKNAFIAIVRSNGSYCRDAGRNGRLFEVWFCDTAKGFNQMYA